MARCGRLSLRTRMRVRNTDAILSRLIFVNRYFHPDHPATSQVLCDLTFHLAAAGREVHVVTSQQKYDDPDAELRACEAINDVHVHRVASTRFGRSALPGRAVDYLSFYRSVRVRERQELIQGLFDRTRFGRLAQPGRDERVAKIAHLLPPSASTLCLLSCFGDDELTAAVDAGIIHPGATRPALTAWLKRRRRDHGDEEKAMVTHAIIRRPLDGRRIYSMNWTRTWRMRRTLPMSRSTIHT